MEESERERILDALADSYARDTLSLEEYERRIELVQTSRSLGDLERSCPGILPPDMLPRSTATGLYAPRFATILSSRTFDTVDSPYTPFLTVMGDTKIDLRGHRFPEGVTEINIFCLMGSTRILVRGGDICVENRIIPIMGDSSVKNGDALRRSSLRVLRLSGAVIMGELQLRVE